MQTTQLQLVRSVPTANAEMDRKHRAQILEHERRFGTLGTLQTKKQRDALRRALKVQEAQS